MESPENKPEQKPRYRVILKSAPDPDQAAEVILRRVRMDEDRVRGIVRSLPAEVATNMDPLYADDLAGALREIGGEAEKKIIPSSVICSRHPDQRGRSMCMVCGNVICNECIKEADGQRLCAEHSGADKPELPSTFPWVKVVLLLILVGVGAFAWYTITKPREPFPFDRPYKLAIVGFMVDLPEQWRKVVNEFQKDSNSEYVDLQNHTLPHMTGWFQREYERYGGQLEQALEIEIFGPFDEMDVPPPPPSEDQSFFDRYIQWRKLKDHFRKLNTRHKLDLSDFDGVIYINFVEGGFDEFLESWAVRRYNIGLVNCYLNKSLIETNIMIVLHETFHLLNAKDHYDINGNPTAPEGFADPFTDPVYPQLYADIMAGRIATDVDESTGIYGLMQLRANIYTAYEVGWIEEEDFINITTVTKMVPSLE